MLLFASCAAIAHAHAGLRLSHHGVLQPKGARSSPSVAVLAEPSRPTTEVPVETSRVRRPEIDEWREFEGLRGDGFDEEKLRSFFARRPQLVVGRLAEVAGVLRNAKAQWDASEGLATGQKSDEFDPTKDVRDEEPESGTRGAMLAEAMASLGPVSVKISQTLSQRPDLIGDEAATALKRLQTSNVPYDDALAWAVIKESLDWDGPIAPGVGIDDSTNNAAPPLFASITASPVAVASLGQVSTQARARACWILRAAQVLWRETYGV